MGETDAADARGGDGEMKEAARSDNAAEKPHVPATEVAAGKEEEGGAKESLKKGMGVASSHPTGSDPDEAAGGSKAEGNAPYEKGASAAGGKAAQKKQDTADAPDAAARKSPPTASPAPAAPAAAVTAGAADAAVTAEVVGTEYADQVRLCALIEAGYLSANEELLFEIKASQYTATLLSDGCVKYQKKASHSGSLVGPREHFDSPREWAQTITKRHNTKRGARSRSRGKTIADGWKDVFYEKGHSLDSLRLDLLADKTVSRKLKDAVLLDGELDGDGIPSVSKGGGGKETGVDDGGGGGAVDAVAVAVGSKRSRSDSPVDGSGEGNPKRARSTRDKAVQQQKLEELQGIADDPAAAEAAAVAAAAEKEEAVSRARRTTRLAAGKIKLVDYKMAEAVKREGSGGKDGEEGGDASGTRSSSKGRAPKTARNGGKGGNGKDGAGEKESGTLDGKASAGSGSSGEKGMDMKDEEEKTERNEEKDSQGGKVDEVAAVEQKEEDGMSLDGNEEEVAGSDGSPKSGSSSAGKKSEVKDPATPASEEGEEKKEGVDGDGEAGSGEIDSDSASSAEEDEDLDDSSKDSDSKDVSSDEGDQKESVPKISKPGSSRRLLPAIEDVISHVQNDDADEEDEGGDEEDGEGEGEDDGEGEGEDDGEGEEEGEEGEEEGAEGEEEGEEEGDEGEGDEEGEVDGLEPDDEMEFKIRDAEGRETRTNRRSRSLRRNTARGSSVESAAISTRKRKASSTSPPSDIGMMDVEEGDDDLSAELEDLVEDDDEEPRDEDGWSVSELHVVGSAVKSSASLNPGVVMTTAAKSSSGTTFEMTQDEVEEYLQAATGVIRELCPRSSSTASTEGGIRINDMLAFIAAEVWRLVSGVQRPAGEISAKIRKETRRRAGIEKLRRKLKRDLEEARAKLEGEMDSRRRIDLEMAYHQLRFGDCHRAVERERSKRRRIEVEIELYKRRDADCKERIEQVKVLTSQLRGEQMAATSVADEPSAAQASASDGVTATNSTRTSAAAKAVTAAAAKDDAMKVDTNVAAASTDVTAGAGTTGESGTSAEIEARKKTDDAMQDVGDNDAAVPSGASPADLAAENAQETFRLRSLIMSYEAEAAANQRASEIEHVRMAALTDVKVKLENEMYIQRAPAAHYQSASNANASGALAASRKLASALPSSSPAGAGASNLAAGSSVKKGDEDDIPSTGHERYLVSKRRKGRRKGYPVRSPQA